MAIPEPWPHQQAAIDWIRERRASYLHLTMGAGKSRCVVSAADDTHSMRVLIVAPKSVVASVWPNQFSTWSERPWRVAPATALGKSVKARLKGIEKKLEQAQYDRAPFVAVINYAMLLSREVTALLKRAQFDLVVFDEAQKLKSSQGKTSKAAMRITSGSTRVVMLSGTPMPHSPMDIFAQFRALDSDVFGRSFVSFRARYAQMGGYKAKQVIGYQREAEMASKMSHLMFSPPDDAVKLNLPEARHEIVSVDLDVKARKLYDSLANDLNAEIAEGRINASNGLVRLLRMQQLCSGLAVVEPDEPVGKLPDEQLANLLAAPEAREEIEVCIAKRTALTDLLESSDEPIVVFGQFRQDIRVARQAASAANTTIAELSGEANELELWRNGGARVLVVQIASGAEGIDLTRARLCVYLSTGFNLGLYLQSLARVHRPGQNRAVTYYHIHARETIDEIVWKVLHRREELVAGVLKEVTGGS
ncbi:DEAD/DEAH box helicase [bacterium]|nr:DEAD/DEAH box helicase [bacterium]